MKKSIKIELDKNITLVESAYISEYTESGLVVITINLKDKSIECIYGGEINLCSTFYVDSDRIEERINIPYIKPPKTIISKMHEKNQVLFIITPFSLLN